METMQPEDLESIFREEELGRFAMLREMLGRWRMRGRKSRSKSRRDKTCIHCAILRNTSQVSALKRRKKHRAPRGNNTGDASICNA